MRELIGSRFFIAKTAEILALEQRPFALNKVNNAASRITLADEHYPRALDVLDRLAAVEQAREAACQT